MRPQDICSFAIDRCGVPLDVELWRTAWFFGGLIWRSADQFVYMRVTR